MIHRTQILRCDARYCRWVRWCCIARWECQCQCACSERRPQRSHTTQHSARCQKRLGLTAWLVWNESGVTGYSEAFCCCRNLWLSHIQWCDTLKGVTAHSLWAEWQRIHTVTWISTESLVRCHKGVFSNSGGATCYFKARKWTLSHQRQKYIYFKWVIELKAKIIKLQKRSGDMLWAFSRGKYKTEKH